MQEMSKGAKGDNMSFFKKEMDAEMDQKLTENFYDPEHKKKESKKIRKGFVISLIVLLCLTVLNWGIISDWGKVDIERVKAVGSNGAEWSALVYRPKTATDENPAPTVIMFHGSAGNARNHESWAVEFARRGFVVIVPDLNGSGDALYTDSEKESHLEPNFWYQYMLNLPFVDKDNILATGHSAGTTQAWDLGAKYNAKGILTAAGVSPFSGHYKAPEGTYDPGRKPGEKPRDIIYTEWNEDWFKWVGNCVVCMGEAEMTNYSGVGDWNVFLQRGVNILNKYPGYENATEIEPDKLYGSFENNTGFIFCKEDYRIHEAAFVSKITIGNLLKYGQQIIGDKVPNFIDSSDQVWMYKDYTGMLCCIAFAYFLFALAFLLMDSVPAFAAVRRPIAKNIGERGVVLPIIMLLGLVIPYIVIKTDLFGFIGTQGRNMVKYGFRLRYASLNFGVVLGNSLFALLGLIAFLVSRKKEKYTLADLGLAPADYDAKAPFKEKAAAVWSMLGPSILLTLIVVAVGWSYMQLMLEVFGTDFYCWFFGNKDIHIAKLPAMLPYLIGYVFCQLVINVDMNVIRRLPTTGNETKDIIVSMLINMFIAVFIVTLLVAMKWHLQSSNLWAIDGSGFWKTSLDVQRIFGLPLGMAIASTGSTYIYKKTGNVWFCALLIGFIACIMGTLYGQYQFDFTTVPVLK